MLHRLVLDPRHASKGSMEQILAELLMSVDPPVAWPKIEPPIQEVPVAESFYTVIG